MELSQLLVIAACLAFLLACIIIPARLGLIKGREDETPCHGDCAACASRLTELGPCAGDVPARPTIPTMTPADNHGRWTGATPGERERGAPRTPLSP